VTPEKPKYRFPEGLHKGLEMFGACQLKEKAPYRFVYLVESPLCVMKFHQLGLPAVSPFGWTLTIGQCKILQDLAKGCVYLPDADKRAEAFSAAGLIARHVWCRMPHFTKEDPEDLTLEEIKSLT
jgi:DNA primase